MLNRSTESARNQILPILLAAGLVAHGAWLNPEFAHADNLPRARREERLESITKLKPEDREKLSDRFHRFQKLDQQQKAELQTLQQELDAAGNSSLRDVMAVYSAWIKSLSIADREELRQITNADKRLEKIKEILNRQPVRIDSPTDHSPTATSPDKNQKKPKSGEGNRFDRPLVDANWGNIGPRGGRTNVLVLPQDDFLHVIGALESLAAPMLDKDQRKLLDAQQGYLRHVKLLELLMRQDYPDRPNAQRLTLDPARIDEIVAGISERELRMILQNAGSNDRKRQLLLFSVAQSLFAEFDRTIRPKEAQLKQFKETLPADVKEQLKSLSEAEQKRRVHDLYVMSHPQEFPAHVLDFQRVVRQFVIKNNLFEKLQNKNGRPRFRPENSGGDFKPRDFKSGPEPK